MENTPPLPTLTRTSSTGAKAMAAFTAFATQAKGLTSGLQRPTFLAPLWKAEPPPPATKSHSSSALSTSDEASDEVEEEPSPAAAPVVAVAVVSRYNASFYGAQRSRLASEDALPPALLPWERRDENGDVVESAAVREKVLALSMYRRTFVEDADGEDDYTFNYATYKDVARRLLLSDPSLREKYSSLIQHPPAFVLSEETFWRNFFLRCNTICVDEGLPPYLPPVVRSSLPAVASFQRFTRDVFLKTQRSSAELEKLRRSLLQPKWPLATGSMDENDPTTTMLDDDEDDELGELELDLDGEIERELMQRRPSRAMAYHKSITAEADAVGRQSVTQ